MSVLVIAMAQTATSPPADSEPLVVATTAEQVLGTWVSQIGAVVIRFDEDGTLRSARSTNTLESAPYATNSYRFEGGEMFVTEIGVSGVPSCGDAVGRYKVWLLENGHLQIVAIGDPCDGRASEMTREYLPTESAGYVVVTSGEQILGTWQHLAARTRFDDDGTFRSAWSANTLESAPYATSSYRFEGGEMLVTELAVSDVPSCGDAVGRYRVWLLESGELQIVAIEDPCPARSGDMTRVYERVE